MTNLPRTLMGHSIGRGILAAAIAGAGSSGPAVASVWSSQPCPTGTCRTLPPREMPDTGGNRLIGNWDIDFDRAIERIRKSPFEHYSHNPDDLRARPLCPPYCSPYGGYFEPTWRQMPPMPEAMPHEAFPSTMIYGDAMGQPGTEFYPHMAPPYLMSPPTVVPGSMHPSTPPVPPAPPASQENVFPEEPPAGIPPGDGETFLPPADSPAASRDQPYLRLGAGPALSSPSDPF